jgi:hypothetical protein
VNTIFSSLQHSYAGSPVVSGFLSVNEGEFDFDRFGYNPAGSNLSGGPTIKMPIDQTVQQSAADGPSDIDGSA